MLDNEGSLSSEDSDIDDAEETQDDAEESTDSTEGKTSTTDKTVETGEKAEAASTDSSLKDQEQNKDKPELTEKGTKLDADPLSRVNQELANERAKIKQYEEVLNNPILLKNYVAQIDKPGTQKEETVTEKEMRYEDVQTTEDLQKFLKQQDAKVQSKMKELDSTISEVKSSQKNTTVAARIQSDITAVRETYPELNPKSSEYNKELDDAIGSLYEKYDFDPKSKTFKGDASLKDIADIVMKAAGSSKKQGSEEAQTTIRDKRSGRAVSGASKSTPDESNMTAGQIIASRIKAARGQR